MLVNYGFQQPVTYESITKYEFGNKPTFVYTLNTGVIVRAMGFRSEYDGHTLAPALDQYEKLTGKRTTTVDRGYSWNTKLGETIISIPEPFNNKKLNQHRQTKLRKGFRRKAAMESDI